MNAAAEKVDHGQQNATGWADTIAELVAALECDYDRLEELRDMDAADMDESERTELVELEAVITIDGDKMADADAVRERIQESPLSVQIRSGWYSPGETPEPHEFEILLSTGGPALRILGELGEHNEPTRAWLEYQDWGTPWTHYYRADFGDTLLTFCQQFYFGE